MQIASHFVLQEMIFLEIDEEVYSSSVKSGFNASGIRLVEADFTGQKNRILINLIE